MNEESIRKLNQMAVEGANKFPESGCGSLTVYVGDQREDAYAEWRWGIWLQALYKSGEFELRYLGIDPDAPEAEEEIANYLLFLEDKHDYYQNIEFYDDSDYMSVSMVALKAGCTRQYVLAEIKVKRLLAKKIGKQWLINKSDFEVWVAPKLAAE